MRWRVLSAALLIAVCVVQLGDGSDRVAFLKPIPRLVRAADQVSFKIRIQADPSNRLLITAAIDDAGEIVRRSDEQLDDHSPVTRWVRWSHLPAGDLSVVAEVWDAQKPLGKASIPLCVMEPFSDCPSLFGP